MCTPSPLARYLCDAGNVGDTRVRKYSNIHTKMASLLLRQFLRIHPVRMISLPLIYLTLMIPKTPRYAQSDLCMTMKDVYSTN